MIKFVSDLRRVWWLSLATPVSSTNKTACHDIAEILLKVALNTINHNPHLIGFTIYKTLFTCDNML